MTPAVNIMARNAMPPNVTPTATPTLSKPPPLSDDPEFSGSEDELEVMGREVVDKSVFITD